MEQIQAEAVETMATLLRKEKPEKKLNVASPTVDVSPEQFIEAQNFYRIYNRVLFKIGIITFRNQLLNMAKNTKSVVFLSTVFNFLF